MEKRLSVFRKLPLRAQLALINSTRDNPVLSQNKEYIENLERIHTECFNLATPEQKIAYEKAKESL